MENRATTTASTVAENLIICKSSQDNEIRITIKKTAQWSNRVEKPTQC